MKTLDVLIIVLIILAVIYLLRNNKPVQEKLEQKLEQKLTYNFINNKSPIIEKLSSNSIQNFPLTFSSLPDGITYIPDDCLPLNFQYDTIANSILLNGSGVFVATNTSLSAITLSSTIQIILNLSLPTNPDITLPITHISFTTGTCDQNSDITNQIINSITVTNNDENPTFLINKYTNIRGSIVIGSISLQFDSFNFGTSLTLEDIYNTTPSGSIIENESTPPFILPKICNIKSCITSTPSSINSVGSIIPASQSIIDQLVNNKTPFALYTNIVNKGIPDNKFTDSTINKLYLSAGLSPTKYTPCNVNNGMFTLSNKLTQGSIFNVTKETRYFPIPEIPYKYLDFDSIETYSTGISNFVSSFYNLSLYTNKYSLSYCLEGCPTTNNHGICAQEQPQYTNRSQFSGNEGDLYNIKNYLKFKLENDDSVTPYFLSFNKGIEKIHFITNKYSTTVNINDYKTVVQVPIYDDIPPYYEIPDVTIRDNRNYYITKKVPITGLNPGYTANQISEYFKRKSLPAEDTQAFKNDAYNKYALNFFVEIIDPTITKINNLPYN